METVVSVGKSGRVFIPKKVIAMLDIEEDDLLLIDIKEVRKIRGEKR